MAKTEVKLRLDIGLSQKLRLKSLIFVAKGGKRRLKAISQSAFKLYMEKLLGSLSKTQNVSSVQPEAHKSKDGTLNKS